MIKPGLTSVTFRKRSPDEVVSLASKAGLAGIEWGGDIHVPAGQVPEAHWVYKLTMEAGLEVSAYGSYYTVGRSRDQGLRFRDVLQTAEVLHAPVVRVWAGDVGSMDATANYRRKVLDETREIADEAGRVGIRIAFEFHENTLNDTYDACCGLFYDLDHTEVTTYWQPVHGAGREVNGAGIESILAWISGIHVFHWWPDASVRLSLREGIDDWSVYLSRLSGISGTVFANLEFVKEDLTEQFFEDAETLLELTGAC